MTDIVERMIQIADASRREDGSDIPLGEQCREAASEIERLRSALSAEREECAKLAEDRAFNAKIARDNFKAIGEHADADRHDHYRTSASEIAAAIRAMEGVGDAIHPDAD